MLIIEIAVTVIITTVMGLYAKNMVQKKMDELDMLANANARSEYSQGPSDPQATALTASSSSKEPPVESTGQSATSSSSSNVPGSRADLE